MQLIGCWSWNLWRWRPHNVNCNISERLWVPLTENLPALAFSEKLHFPNGVLVLLLLLVAVPGHHQHACSLLTICSLFSSQVISFNYSSREMNRGSMNPWIIIIFLSCDVISQYEIWRLYQVQRIFMPEFCQCGPWWFFLPVASSCSPAACTWWHSVTLNWPLVWVWVWVSLFLSMRALW